MKTEITDLKNEILEIDKELAELFRKRMESALEMDKLIKEGKLSSSNTNSERIIISKVTENQNDEMSSYTKVLFNTITLGTLTAEFGRMIDLGDVDFTRGLSCVVGGVLDATTVVDLS